MRNNKQVYDIKRINYEVLIQLRHHYIPFLINCGHMGYGIA
jgi:hypothetical protein